MPAAAPQSSVSAPATVDDQFNKKLLPAFPMLRPWKIAGNDQAFSEGWGLFDVDGRYQLQRLDNPEEIPGLGYEEPKFESDMDVMAHIVLQAIAGSTYHAEAMYSIGALAT